MVYFFLLDRTRVLDLEMRCLNLFKHNTWMGWRCLNCASSLKSLSTPSKARGQRPTQAALLKDIYSLESTKMFLKRGEFLHNAMSSPVISCPVSPITSFGVWSLRPHLRQSTLCGCGGGGGNIGQVYNVWPREHFVCPRFDLLLLPSKRKQWRVGRCRCQTKSPHLSQGKWLREIHLKWF